MFCLNFTPSCVLVYLDDSTVYSVHPPPLFLGMGGQFADLKRGLANKMGGGGCFWGSRWHHNAHYGIQRTTKDHYKNKKLLSNSWHIYKKLCYLLHVKNMLKQAMKQNAAMNVPHYLSYGVIHLVHTRFSKNLTFLPVFWKTLHRS